MSETQSTFEKTNAFARDLFLAYLGLAGKAFERSQELVNSAQDSYKQAGDKVQSLYEQRTELFNDLVKRGEQVQAGAQSKLEEITSNPRAAVESRVEALRSSVDKLKERIASHKQAEASQA